MKKQLLIIGTAVLLLTIGLSGCTEISNPLTGNDDNRFVGTWKGEGVTLIFFTDGTCSYWYGAPATYEIKDNKLVIDVEGGAKQTYNYSFSNNDTTLALTNIVVENTIVFTKQ